MAEVRRREPRLPSGPLVAALHQVKVTRGVTWERLLSAWQLRAYYLAKAEGEVTPYMVGQLCAAVGRDPREVYGNGLAGVILVEPDQEASPVDRRLPAEPLVRIVEARLRCLTERLELLPGRIPAHAEAVGMVLGEDGALLKAYQRAQARGWVTLEAAEQFCDHFGWHPRELWGDRWDEATLAGLPEGYDVWEDVA
jgi:hypothetical protein